MIFNVPDGSSINAAYTEYVTAWQKLGRADLMTWFHPAAMTGNNGGMVGAAFGTGGESYTSGTFEMHTGATTAGGYILQAASDGTTFSKGIRAGQDWFISWRGRITTTPTTGTQAWAGASDQPANFLQLGVVFNTNATQFCLVGPSGSAMASGVAFDTSIHTYRAWHSATLSTSWIQVDSQPAVSGNVDILTDMSPYARAQNGTNANQSMEMVFQFAAAPYK